jgi:hypothetical protein
LVTRRSVRRPDADRGAAEPELCALGRTVCTLSTDRYGVRAGMVVWTRWLTEGEGDWKVWGLHFTEGIQYGKVRTLRAHLGYIYIRCTVRTFTFFLHCGT